jgi:hypothetical protein
LLGFIDEAVHPVEKLSSDDVFLVESRALSPFDDTIENESASSKAAAASPAALHSRKLGD